MFLAVRLVRALFVFGLIFGSYMRELALGRIFGKDDGRGRVLPPWLKERRKRVDQKNAKRLLAGMLRLRGVFIKLGQILSIMGGFLPRVYAKELEQLQDAVPPHPFSDLEDALLASFGKGSAEIFESIDETPLAAASLGQVHVARLSGGRKVAVKFLYPGIRGVIAVDLKVIRLAIVVYRRFVPVVKMLSRRKSHELTARIIDLIDVQLTLAPSSTPQWLNPTIDLVEARVPGAFAPRDLTARERWAAVKNSWFAKRAGR